VKPAASVIISTDEACTPFSAKISKAASSSRARVFWRRADSVGASSINCVEFKLKPS